LRSSAFLFAGSIVGALVVAAGGCTFTGVADYQVVSCTPAEAPPKGVPATDACTALKSSDDCHPYECDPGTHRCVVRPRDDDRDGDPSIACGGADCDDLDSSRASTKHEICNFIDDNCNGLVDDGVQYTPVTVGTIHSGYLFGVARAASTGATVVGSTIGMGGAEVAYIDDTQPTTKLVPLNETGEQPFATWIDGHAVVAYAAVDSTCMSGRLSIHNDQPARAITTCGSTTNGVAAPAIAAFPARTGNGSALVTHYDLTVARTNDPQTSCPIAAPAALRAAVLSDATSQSPSLGTFTTIAPDAIALYPPGLARLDGFGSLLVAVGTPAGTKVWSVTPDLVASAVASVPGLAGAVAVSIATSSDPDHTHVALVAELGCAPHTQLRAVFGEAQGVAALADGGLAPPTLTFGAPVDVTPDVTRAAAPSIAWIDWPGEFEIAWLSDNGTRARRFSATGIPLDDGIDLGPVAAAIAPRYAADHTHSHELVLLGTSPTQWTRVALTCQ
jgi:hypothetical protein